MSDEPNDISILKELKPKYSKKGRPTPAEREAAGFPLKKKEWQNIWNVRHGRNWGGRRRNAGWGKRPPKPKARTKMNFMIDVGYALKLDSMPRGERSNYVNKALALLLDIVEPEHVQKKRRGKQANWVQPPGWEQRPARMSRAQQRKLDLEKAEQKLKAWKEKKAQMLLQPSPEPDNINGSSLL
jgi:hypothetical protein